MRCWSMLVMVSLSVAGCGTRAGDVPTDDAAATADSTDESVDVPTVDEDGRGSNDTPTTVDTPEAVDVPEDLEPADVPSTPDVAPGEDADEVGADAPAEVEDIADDAEADANAAEDADASTGCSTPNPAGCRDRGCGEGERCVLDPGLGCTPSRCQCDEDSGEWACTRDCLGGTCVNAGDTCSSDNECTAGAEWCEGGRCVECDNSGILCRIACEPGTTLYRRNGCSPCACVPESECTSDDECAAWQRCAPGTECLDWCPEDDPTCCYGNRCEDLPD